MARGDGYDGQGGHSLAPGFVAALGSLHVADPFGDETLTNLTGAINGAVQDAERARQAEQSRAMVVAPREPTKWEMGGYLMSSLIRSRSQEIERLYQEAEVRRDEPVQRAKMIQHPAISMTMKSRKSRPGQGRR
jgi:hypothetical protein